MITPHLRGLVIAVAAAGSSGFTLSYSNGQPLRSEEKVVAVAPAYSAALAQAQSMIQREIDRGLVKGVSLALVDDQRTVWAGGLGMADQEKKIPADAETIYRVGSLSKLFTALGTMALSDRGRIDIDQPLTRYYPSFLIGRSRFPQAKLTTLRQLMAHRSGFPRESPVGSYFDDREPGLERTVKSLADCELVNEPESTTKYSNIAVALEGYVTAVVAGKDFEAFQQETILRPLGMSHSSFRLVDAARRKLAAAYMRLPDGREIVAPNFELGTVPAGNLYSSVADMARFMTFVFRGGRVTTEAGSEAIVRRETLREMFRVQYSPEGQRTGFGLAFYIGEVDGHTWVGHAGAVYGFSTQIALLPEEKLGVIVCANQDVVGGLVGSVARRALQWMLAEREGRRGPDLPDYARQSDDALGQLSGCYRAADGWIEVRLERGVGLRADLMGQEIDLRPLGSKRFLAYGGPHYEAPLLVSKESRSISFAGRAYDRVDSQPPVAEAPAGEKAGWKALLGVYGPPFIPTVIQFRYGKLFALVENAFGYEMIPEGEDAFRFPPGLYEGELLTFVRDSSGWVTGLKIGPVAFARRPD